MNLYLKSPGHKKQINESFKLFWKQPCFMLFMRLTFLLGLGFFLLLKKGSFLSIAMNTNVKFYFNSVQRCMNIPKAEF